jgi:hypothetical protein
MKIVSLKLTVRDFSMKIHAPRFENEMWASKMLPRVQKRLEEKKEELPNNGYRCTNNWFGASSRCPC